MISVIIPIYNAEPYLSRCIDSVLCSDYTDFELILVDDGSTDGCLRICQAYAERDPRITVLSQKNQGVSAALNRGLELWSCLWMRTIASLQTICLWWPGRRMRTCCCLTSPKIQRS